jgi:hypothetical protein
MGARVRGTRHLDLLAGRNVGWTEAAQSSRGVTAARADPNRERTSSRRHVSSGLNPMSVSARLTSTLWALSLSRITR